MGRARRPTAAPWKTSRAGSPGITRPRSSTLSLLGTAPPSDTTYANQKKAAAILNAILPLEPRHPGIAHYMIHSFDYPELASDALPAARAYSKIAPSSPHALHQAAGAAGHLERGPNSGKDSWRNHVAGPCGQPLEGPRRGAKVGAGNPDHGAAA